MTTTRHRTRLRLVALWSVLVLAVAGCNLGASGPGDPIEDPTGPDVDGTEPVQDSPTTQ